MFIRMFGLPSQKKFLYAPENAYIFMIRSFAKKNQFGLQPYFGRRINIIDKETWVFGRHGNLFVTRKAITDLMVLAIFDRRSIFNSLLHSHL